MAAGMRAYPGIGFKPLRAFLHDILRRSVGELAPFDGEEIPVLFMPVFEVLLADSLVAQHRPLENGGDGHHPATPVLRMFDDDVVLEDAFGLQAEDLPDAHARLEKHGEQRGVPEVYEARPLAVRHYEFDVGGGRASLYAEPPL